MKQVFKLVDSTFSVKSFPTLPTHDSLEHLVESFGDFFESNIIDIRLSLSQQPSSRPKCVTNVSCSTSFSQFEHVSLNSLKTIIQSSKSKSCALDPIHTWLLKDCIDVVAHSNWYHERVFGSAHFPLFLQEVTNLPSDKKGQPWCWCLCQIFIHLYSIFSLWGIRKNSGFPDWGIIHHQWLIY